MNWPQKPVLYEVNTRVWLATLAEELGRSASLQDVPDKEIQRWKEVGYHAIWLMGVWRSSRHSAALCRESEGLRQEIGQLLGEIQDGDIDASPYAVAGYDVDPVLGGNEALRVFRERLASHGILLVLDFVPNHLAVDHPWVTTRPSRFVCGSPEQVAATPEAFFYVGDLPVAHGRDPHFPPWTDTAQLDYFNPDVHEAMMSELLRVAEQCDGVRCDMAMLLLPQVFGSVWKWASQNDSHPPCFWEHAIPAVKADHPEFRFLAEAYWGLEEALQEKGFDYTYDKILYDHLVSKRTVEIQKHLEITRMSGTHAVRFIENHDEPRAASIFTSEQGRTAAAIALTLPGATLIHQGQEYGWTKRFPVQMRRKPPEPSDHELEEFYRNVTQIVRNETVQLGEWEKLLPEAEKSEELLAYQWFCRKRGESLLFVANLSGQPRKGSVGSFCPSRHEDSVHIEELMGRESDCRETLVYTRVDIPFKLAPWEFTLIRITDTNRKKKGGLSHLEPA